MLDPRSRSDVLPDVHIPERVTGVGSLRRGDTTIPIAAFTLERHAYETDQAWKFVAHVSEQYWSRWEAITAEPGLPLMFEGRADSGVNVRSEVYWNHQTAGRLEGDVWEVRYHRGSPPPSAPQPTAQHIVVRITPTPLARTEVGALLRSFTGTLAPIPTEQPNEPEEVLIPTPLGVARFSLTFRWEEADVAGSRCQLRVPHATMRLAITGDARSADPFALIASVDATIDDSLSVLSLLSRRFVRWTGIYCTSVWEFDATRQISETAVERCQHQLKTEHFHQLKMEQGLGGEP